MCFDEVIEDSGIGKMSWFIWQNMLRNPTFGFSQRNLRAQCEGRGIHDPQSGRFPEEESLEWKKEMELNAGIITYLARSVTLRMATSIMVAFLAHGCTSNRPHHFNHISHENAAALDSVVIKDYVICQFQPQRVLRQWFEVDADSVMSHFMFTLARRHKVHRDPTGINRCDSITAYDNPYMDFTRMNLDWIRSMSGDEKGVVYLIPIIYIKHSGNSRLDPAEILRKPLSTTLNISIFGIVDREVLYFRSAYSWESDELFFGFPQVDEALWHRVVGEAIQDFEPGKLAGIPPWQPKRKQQRARPQTPSKEETPQHASGIEALDWPHLLGHLIALPQDDNLSWAVRPWPDGIYFSYTSFLNRSPDLKHPLQRKFSSFERKYEHGDSDYRFSTDIRGLSNSAINSSPRIIVHHGNIYVNTWRLRLGNGYARSLTRGHFLVFSVNEQAPFIRFYRLTAGHDINTDPVLESSLFVLSLRTGNAKSFTRQYVEARLEESPGLLAQFKSEPAVTDSVLVHHIELFNRSLEMPLNGE